MDDIRIRRGTLADLPHILRHREGMFRDMGYPAGALADFESASQAYFESAIPKGSYVAWLAEAVDERVVAGAGLVIADWPGGPIEAQPRRAWILNVFTEPGYRRRGVARRLMEEVVAWCRAEKFAAVSLHASREGRPLYEAMGFTATNEMRLDL